MTEQARLYGTVLYELGLPEAAVSETLDILGKTPELLRVLTSPAVSTGKKHAVLEQVFEKTQIPPLMIRFLKKACDAGCIGEAGDIVAVYKKRQLEAQGVLEASLFFVTPPDEGQIEGIKRFLCRRHGAQDVKLNLVPEPDLIGGFRLKAGDIEYDYSLKGRLLRLKKAVMR